MTNPTSNFGWQMPTSTDLVTDLPADFETFGQAVDTSLAELKGGTTGQVLSKTSNTDMDFTWVTSDDANAIQNTIVDAKGDLIAASASDVPARLAVGNNGETLVADSSTSTGLRYQGSMASGKNGFINGGFDIWQRGTSFTSTGVYMADRWYLGGSNPNMTNTRVAGTDGSTYALRLQRNSGSTSTAGIPIGQSVEIANATPYQGKTVTISFMARAGANFSAASNNITVQFITGTSSTEANRMAVAYASGDTTAINSSATLTTSWQRFSYTTTLGATVSQFFIYIERGCTGTAGANDWCDITNVQIEVGSVATNFTRTGGTIQGELAACQRYYYVSDAKVVWWGNVTSGQNYYGNWWLPVPMRVAPTMTTTDIENAGFNSGAPSTTVIGKFSFWAFKGANATGVGQFQFTYTASAEL